ncbi:phenylalanine--tRNA ligase subunit beta [Propionibacterium australiense]|uniref:Phenylalanine--tRNA ligase beta subunit n=1 Tax=Propionibacterium australiense TaxID=119981 RepID=A0A383S8R2_9ACTN|nr:phenylalanine--tRNA ligase subunit beta [Propionibacterium australiense]RLP06496.1 phenylalanine--tRNA ligase subunit beta [Propionibacterium australiense]RLP06564.1 phenylalanine--tRNA ligase subunit beta [Propionibacterium australiense]SYZ34380.1 Phenylalanine-tRNA ligase [Propionibacterium australiense]VEH92065.1 Phenylalanine--tRNA ligase beta subunit [Propionibacterium australiense]
MRVPMSWLRDLVEFPHGVTTSQVADAFTRRGLQVEHVETVGAELAGPIVVGRVLDFVEESQKNGKTIRWCRVDVGPLNDSEVNSELTDARGIVCGATNFAKGDYVVVSLPGAVLAGGFEISARRTYGHMSDGMICAADELGTGEDHSGIIVLPPVEAARAGLGSDALPLLGVPDDVLDIEVTPDLGYALSMRGLAREAAQAFDVPYNDLYSRRVPAQAQGAYPVRIDSQDCQLFVNLCVNGIDPKAPTPMWMRHRLEASGMRSISLPVDITNYVMLESGQPLHGYDADSLLGPIVVRKAAAGERLTTLDDVERTLSADDLLITDDSGPIGLAGVMGGQTTELSETTTNVVIEAAHFSPGTIGRTYRLHKLPSEASKRFERTVDPGVACAAARMAARLFAEHAGGTIVDGTTVAGQVPVPPSLTIDANLPARILGARIDTDRVVEVFEKAGITVKRKNELLELTPPTWRTDLRDPYDYVEEIGRKLGLDIVEARVPRAAAGRGLSPAQRARRAVNAAVAQAGFVEVITLPFIAAEEPDRLGLPADCDQRRLVRLANPLADTAPYLRTGLLPGLFSAVTRNTSRGHDDLALFEAGSVFWARPASAAPMPDVTHRPSDAEIAAIEESLPDQPRMIAAVLTGQWLPATWNRAAVRADWTHAVYFAQTAAQALGLDLERRAAAIAPWHPGRCAELSVRGTAGEPVVIGAAGELHPEVVKAYGLPDRSCAVEINLDLLVSCAPDGGQVSALSAFPLAKEDVALIVSEKVAASDVEAALAEGAGDLLESIVLFDIFRGTQIGEGRKSLAYNLRFRGADRTLTQADVAAARGNAVRLAVERFDAILREA